MDKVELTVWVSPAVRAYACERAQESGVPTSVWAGSQLETALASEKVVADGLTISPAVVEYIRTRAQEAGVSPAIWIRDMLYQAIKATPLGAFVFAKDGHHGLD